MAWPIALKIALMAASQLSGKKQQEDVKRKKRHVKRQQALGKIKTTPPKVSEGKLGTAAGIASAVGGGKGKTPPTQGLYTEEQTKKLLNLKKHYYASPY